MKRSSMPKLIESLRGYDLPTFLSDLIAGLTVGLVALPLAMAFAISSGVQPQAGIYGAVVAGILITALGGESVAVGRTANRSRCDVPTIMMSVAGVESSSPQHDATSPPAGGSKTRPQPTRLIGLISRTH